MTREAEEIVRERKSGKIDKMALHRHGDLRKDPNIASYGGRGKAGWTWRRHQLDNKSRQHKGDIKMDGGRWRQ